MANELPEDLVIQILLWLPVVSLLRFKSVCKSWYALITNQNFIRKHLLHNKNNNTPLLLQMRDETTTSYVVSTLSYGTHQMSLTQPVPPPSFWIDKGHISIVAYCNGLICLRGQNKRNVVIWNPATKETKVVPKSNMPLFPARDDTRIEAMGFGYDAKTNDYKIINLISCKFSLNNFEKIVQSKVYSLSADSWRKVDSPLCFNTHNYSFYCKTYSLSLNGMVSWLAWAYDWEGVLSFEMSNEVFIITLLPDVVRGEDRSQDLFVLKESIAMAVSIWDDEDCSGIITFEIWLLLEVGVKESWTKLFTVGPFTGIQNHLGFWKNETMLLEKYDGQLVLYDPSTKELIDLPILQHGSRYQFQLVTNYMETLVSIKGGNEFEEEYDSC